MVQTVAEQLLYSPYAIPTGNQSKPWSVFDKSNGCVAIKNSPLCLKTDKSPPSKTKEKPKNEGLFSTAPPPSPPKEKGWGKMFNDVQKLTQSAAPKEQKLPPPFDLRDIPGAMQKMGWSVGAKLSQRWLDGRAHATPGSDAIFPTDMVDTTTVKLNWLMGFKDVKAKYNALIRNDSIFTFNSKNVLKNKLRVFFNQTPLFYEPLDTFVYCKGDIQQLHKQFQFQKQPVSTWDGLHQFGMTDVTAALGGFFFYVAIAKATVKNPRYFKYSGTGEKTLCSHPVISVTHIYVYAKDIYSFESTEGKTSSQYLGHWNKTGIIAVGAVSIASAINEQKWAPDFTEIGNSELSNYVVDTGAKNLIEKEVYYPVRNRNYREYRDKHQHGGDFVIYSDMQMLKLPNPIDIDLGEICR